MCKNAVHCCLTAAVIVGSIVGIVAVIALTAVVIAFVVRCRSRQVSVHRE